MLGFLYTLKVTLGQEILVLVKLAMIIAIQERMN